MAAEVIFEVLNEAGKPPLGEGDAIDFKGNPPSAPVPEEIGEARGEVDKILSPTAS